MLPASNKLRPSVWIGWIVAGLLLVMSAWMVAERQLVIDTVQYHQFTPSSKVAGIADRLQLTDKAEFTFYASHPLVEGRDSFNQHCKRQEANSPILGCYASGQIFIYGVNDERLDGIEEVTAAHELLHAEYERLSDAEKEWLEPRLKEAYSNITDEELTARMEYYQRTEPGEMMNELHSILPTEFPNIGDELEEYYKKYFKNRQIIVDLNTKSSKQFTSLQSEASNLVEQINGLVASINSDTKRYNESVASLNARVIEFNAKANQQGGFSSQAEFDAEYAALETERSELENLRKQVEANLATHKQLLAQLEAINTQTESLNASVDSVLSDEPEI